MYLIKYTSAFKKDFKRIKKRGLAVEKLVTVIDLLVNEKALPTRCRPHKLVGNYEGFWECHIEPDWLLVYEYDDDEQELRLRRTGSHSDLFR